MECHSVPDGADPGGGAPAAQASIARRQAAGKTRREAIRALKRYLVRAVWRQWQRCVTTQAQPAASPAQEWDAAA